MSEVKVVEARIDQKSTINNLAQFYLYDMASEYYPFWPVGEDGLYEYGTMDRFWQYPYVLYYGEELVGFSLVIDHCPVTGQEPCWFMAEMFVLRQYRNKGIGLHAVREIFEKHRGRWHIAVIAKHTQALKFWKRTLPSDSIGNSRICTHEREDWEVFETRSP